MSRCATCHEGEAGYCAACVEDAQNATAAAHQQRMALQGLVGRAAADLYREAALLGHVHAEWSYRMQARIRELAEALEQASLDDDQPELGECGVVLPGTRVVASSRTCERVGVGLGTDQWDPVCDLPDGHDGPCNWSGEPTRPVSRKGPRA